MSRSNRRRFVVIVTWEDMDDAGGPLPDVMGPYYSYEAAKEFRAKLQERINKIPPDDEGARHVHAYVKTLDPPRIRTLIRRARDYVLNGQS